MDTKLEVSIFREHGEHIRKLSTELSEVLGKFEQAVSDPANVSATEAARLLGEIVNLNNSLFSVADIFYQRVRRFTETRTIGGSSTSGN